MLDFVTIEETWKKDEIEISPDFRVKKSKDLMIKGNDFYAVWVEEAGLWSTDEDDLIELVDHEIDAYIEANKNRFIDKRLKRLYMRKSSSGSIDRWHKYCQHQCRDNFRMLNENLIFANMPVRKEDYASVRLGYSLEQGECPSWNEIISTLYSPEERHKIEWCIGAIVTGASKDLQKFLVFYGPKGSGKSTIINIIQDLFKGYWAPFSSKALGSSNAEFALEPFKNGPLVAIEHDGNLSRIEDNTRLNSLVSHESMTVNEKFKSLYANAFKTFLIMGTNNPVRITDAKSGILRRLIDVNPTEKKIPRKRYDILTNQVKFELGAIAYHCAEVFNANPNYYDDYVPISMMGATNDFYNFVESNYTLFKKDDCVTLKAAWAMYKEYCDDAKVRYPMSYTVFREELKSYFWEFSERSYTDDGRLRNLYSRFRTEKFDMQVFDSSKPKTDSWLKFEEIPSLLDEVLKECPAQYANEAGTPEQKWDKVSTVLLDLDTSRLHYVKDLPDNLIVIDFDIPDENGKKCFEKNLEAASKWPQTYAELSKSGAGIHLHYYYKGDVSQLKRIFAPNIEIKVYKGNAALRRLVVKCNDIPIATISSGLPVKEGDSKVINEQAVKSEKGLRDLISRNLRKEIHPGTKPSVEFIKKILDDAYESGLKYDVSDLYTSIAAFAGRSTNHSIYCMSLIKDMKFKSDEPPTTDVPLAGDDDIWFYDIEVFPNLLLINYKKYKDPTMYRMINPSPQDIEQLIRRKLVGFNCRRYDNHILYARLIGYTLDEIYHLSQRIIKGESGCFFSQAYNISWTDIYDFAAAHNKMSLKKLQIKMGIHHQELGYDWDKPVPEDKWQEVSEYCDNDVISTEKAFDFLQDDFTAREILAELAGLSVNDTTNTLTTRIIFGLNKNPQSEFCYRDLSKPVDHLDPEVEEFLKEACPKMMSQTHVNDGITFSKLPYFPGYVFDHGVSTYRGRTVGEGGYVYAEPGMYSNVALLDVASMHPHSAIAECLFGPRFTRIFREIVEGRVSIKHQAWNEINTILGGKLTPFIQRVIDGKLTAKKLADALKTAINSVYGLTAAGFENPFRDKRNLDNIVAKRGALFMINLEDEVKRLGFTVAHIKTDSIKIPNATPEIIKFVMDYAENYGYTFEHEATYERMCLVNDAVYIAKYADAETCMNLYGYIPGDNKDAIAKEKMWTATGTQFSVPYVFKSLFSKDPLIFSDYCETKQVSKGALYLRKPDGDQFIGRVGQFTPMKEGYGYELATLRDDKFYAPPGTKGYLWLESEEVLNRHLENFIDESYYENLKNEAAHTIIAYGDFDAFVSDQPFTTEYGEQLPFAV
jgi:hypothetical protein